MYIIAYIIQLVKRFSKLFAVVFGNVHGVIAVHVILRVVILFGVVGVAPYKLVNGYAVEVGEQLAKVNAG